MTPRQIEEIRIEDTVRIDPRAPQPCAGQDCKVFCVIKEGGQKTTGVSVLYIVDGKPQTVDVLPAEIADHQRRIVF